MSFGYLPQQLARELGIEVAGSAMTALLNPKKSADTDSKHFLTDELRNDVGALFDRLQMVPGSSQEAKEYGRKHHWALPFEWDEDNIDNPEVYRIRSRRYDPSRAGKRDQEIASRREQVRELTLAGYTRSQIAARLHVTPYVVGKDRRRQDAPTPHSCKQQRALPDLDWGLDR